MGFLGKSLDDSNIPEGTGFDLIEPGWYTATVEKVEIKDTKAKDGSYLNIQFKINGPTRAGRVVFGTITLRNPSPEAEAMGDRYLQAMRSSLGIAKLTDSDQLVGGTLEINVKISKSPGYDDKNEVKGYKAVNGSAPPMPKPTAQPSLQPQPPKPAAGPSPWNKPKPAAQPAPQPEEDPFA
jgi:hypothetical protein